MTPVFHLSSLKGKSRWHKDRKAWKQAVIFMPNSDLKMYLGIWEDLQEFEVCAIIKKELAKR